MAMVPWRRHSENAVTRRPDEGYLPLRQVMDRLFQESFLSPSLFDRFFDGAGSFGGATGTNLWETNDSYVAQMAMPGVKPDSIDCSIDGSTLVCRAESAVQAPENATSVWQSYQGQTEYHLQLPAEVEGDKAEAKYEQGTLTVKVPKVAKARAKSIKVAVK